MMKPQIELSPEERNALERIFTIRSQKAKHTITLSYLMDQWSRFVMKVEEEYRLTIDDYTNSLSVRNLIQEVLDICPGNAGLKQWVREWDNRFAKATKGFSEPLLPPLHKEDQAWWWYRFPTNPGSELRKWLQITKQE